MQKAASRGWPRSSATHVGGEDVLEWDAKVGDDNYLKEPWVLKKGKEHVTIEKDTNNRAFGTAAVISRCVSAGVNFVRVHDVKENIQVIKMTKAIIK